MIGERENGLSEAGREAKKEEEEAEVVEEGVGAIEGGGRRGETEEEGKPLTLLLLLLLLLLLFMREEVSECLFTVFILTPDMFAKEGESSEGFIETLAEREGREERGRADDILLPPILCSIPLLLLLVFVLLAELHRPPNTELGLREEVWNRGEERGVKVDERGEYREEERAVSGAGESKLRVWLWLLFATPSDMLFILLLLLLFATQLALLFKAMLRERAFSLLASQYAERAEAAKG